MRATYRVLALLVAVGVVVQAMLIAIALFQINHDTDNGGVFDKNSSNWAQGAHALDGYIIIPLLALVLLILSFFARIPGGVKWAAIVFGLVVLQILLAGLGMAAPVAGALHGLNAFALAGVASVAARKARTAETAAPAASAETSTTA